LVNKGREILKPSKKKKLQLWITQDSLLSFIIREEEPPPPDSKWNESSLYINYEIEAWKLIRLWGSTLHTIDLCINYHQRRRRSRNSILKEIKAPRYIYTWTVKLKLWKLIRICDSPTIKIFLYVGSMQAKVTYYWHHNDNMSANVMVNNWYYLYVKGLNLRLLTWVCISSEKKQQQQHTATYWI
jgi:hypothetical protein